MTREVAASTNSQIISHAGWTTPLVTMGKMAAPGIWIYGNETCLASEVALSN